VTEDPAAGPGASLEFLIDEINGASLAVLRWYRQEMSSQPYSEALEAKFNREAERIDVFERLVTRHLINVLALIKGNPLPTLRGYGMAPRESLDDQLSQATWAAKRCEPEVVSLTAEFDGGVARRLQFKYRDGGQRSVSGQEAAELLAWLIREYQTSLSSLLLKPSPGVRKAIIQRGFAAMALLSSYYVCTQDQVVFYAKSELNLPPRLFRPDDQGIQETDAITQLMELLWSGKWGEPSVVRPSAWLHTALRKARGFRELEHKERSADVDQLPEFQEHGYAATPAMWVSPRGERVNPLDLQGDAALPVDAETDSEAAIRAAAGDDEEFGAVVHELLAGVSADSGEHGRLPGAPRVLDDPDTWRNIAARRGIPPGERSHFSRDFKKRHRHRWYILQRALWPYFRRSERPEMWGVIENKENIVSKNLAQTPERSPRT
jgi:hypothetical protein